MTKIKKSIWSAVVGVVMSLALVFGVFAGVKSNRVANAAYDADQYVAEFKFIMTNFLEQFGEEDGYTTEMLVDDVEYTVAMEDGSFERTSTRMAAYLRAKDLYEELNENDPNLLTADRYIRLAVGVFNEIKDMIAELDPIIADIVGTEEGQLGYMLAREDKYYTCPQYTYGTGVFENPTATVLAHKTSVIFSDKAAYDTINAAFEALDEYQQEYVRRNTNRGINLFEVGYSIQEILQLQTEVKTESFALEVAVDETDVLYSYKAAYDAVTNKYNGLDPTAKAETNVAAAYEAIAGLGEVFEDIEEKADAAKTAINNMLYYFEGEMVANPQGEVVVDTQASYDAVADALNAIYNGRRVGTYKVANFATFEAVPAEEKEALSTYLTELNRYTTAGQLLAQYKAEAAEVEADIEELEVTAENHYKVVENDINEVYDAYDALNTPNYNGHHNKQVYVAEANRTKIVEYKTTLDALNSWIREVADLVDSRNDLEELGLELSADSSVADVDEVIAWALENDFLFSVNDKAAVDALVESYEVLADDEAKVNSLHDAREVLRLLKEKIDEAIALEEAKVEELKDLLDTIGDLLTNGVKYADRVVYDHFTEVYETLSDASKEELQAEENWGNYDALGEALDVIAERAYNLSQLVDAIVYRHGNGDDVDYTVDTNEVDGEIVVYSKESVEAAKAAVAALYNGDELVAENEVEYKIATLAYPWAEDVVETADGNVNAFVYYFVQVDMEAYYAKYDAAVADLAALEAEAQDVEDAIDALVITNYRAQRTEIETLYETYNALERGEYNDLRTWVENGEKITTAHEVLADLDRWVLAVALAIDNYNDPRVLDLTHVPTVEEVDALINNTNVEDVKLTLAQVEAFLEVYDTLTDYNADTEARDEVKAVSVKEAHDLLVARKDAIEEEIEEFQNDVDALEELLNDGVKYADREKYEELLERLENLDPSAEVDTTNLDYLGEALELIEETVENLRNALDEIVYRHGNGDDVPYTVDTNEVDGEIVVASKASVEAAQAAVEEIYNGYEEREEETLFYRLANLEYNWAEDVIETAEGNVPAFVYYELLSEEDYAKYDAAVADLEALKAEAAAYQAKVDAFELTKANNYKVQEATIEELYAEYQGLNHGTYNNVQEWVTAVKVTEAKQVLDLLNGWIEAVATAIDADLTEEEGADAVIAAAKAGDVEVNLTLPQVEGLLANYETVTAEDEIREESVRDAYELLVARKEAIEEAAEELQDELDELEQLLEDGVKYSDREKYEELLERANELEELGAELDTSNLETVGEALAEIERRTNALKTAIDNIEYYLDGEMVKDPAGEVVYDTKESLEAATEAVEAVYDGTEHIAALEFPWGETEEAALARWSEDTGIEAEDLAKYKAALAEFNRLWDIEKAVAQRVDDLDFTAENHYKTQEEAVNELWADVVRLTHEAEYIAQYGIDPTSTETYNNHNNWIEELGEEKVMKIFGAYLTVNAINDFDLEVAQLVDETLTRENSTIEEIDAFLLETIENGFGDRVTFNPRKIVYELDFYAQWVEATQQYQDALVESLKPAKTVLDMMYNAAKTLNNDLVEDVLDIIERKDNLVEADYDKIMYVKDTYDQLSNLQKSILENNEEYTDEEGYGVNTEYFYEELGWLTIYPHTIDEFLDLANKFEFALYFKQAVDELVNELDTTYFTVEGYVLEKALLSMYCNFDPSMQAMVTSSYQNLLRIDAAYKEMSRDEYTSYTTVTEELEEKIDDAKADVEDLEAEIKEALGQENAETVQEALANYKAAVEQAQAELEAAKDALVESITNSLDPEAETVEEAFETYKAAVAEAQEALETAQDALVEEIKTALGDEEAASVEEALSNYKASVETTQQEAAKAAADDNKENDEKVASLKKALIITAVVGGVVAVAAVACIVVLFAKMAALGGAGAAGSSAAGSAAAQGGKDEE